MPEPVRFDKEAYSGHTDIGHIYGDDYPPEHKDGRKGFPFDFKFPGEE